MAHFTREEFLCIFTPLPPKTADFRYFWVWFSCFWCTKHKPDALPSVLYFCVFVNAKRQGVRIHLIKSTNESFIDYYIYYRHAHLFSQKHKNAKEWAQNTKLAWGVCRATQHFDDWTSKCKIRAQRQVYMIYADWRSIKISFTPLQARGIGKITAWRGRKIFLATQKNKAFITKSTCSNKILQNKQR